MIIIENKVTIYTIAKELNMTPSMVSRALSNGKVSEINREAVLKIAKKYNYIPNKFASRLSMKTIKIAIIINASFRPVCTEIINGVKKSYDELKDYKIEYNIFNSVFADFNAKDYDGIIISGCGKDEYKNVLETLYKDNKNIVMIQNVNEDVPYLFSSEFDTYRASLMSAEFLHNCLRFSNSKNVVLFTGSQHSFIHKKSMETFLKTAELFNLNIVACYDMEDNDEILKRYTEDAFSKYEINGIYITSGVSLSLCKYIKDKKLNIPLVTFDVYDELNSYIKDGTVSATIFQNAEHQAKQAFEKLVLHIINGESVEKKLYTDTHLVMSSNLDLFEKNN